MGNREYCMVSGLIFTLVALAHFLRIVMGMSVLVDGYVVPMYVSWIAVVVTGALAVWAFRSRTASGQAG